MGWLDRLRPHGHAVEPMDPYTDAVDEARHLLEHAVKSGLDIAPARLRALTRAIHNAFDDTLEAKETFWLAYHELAQRLSPVSGASLQAVNGAEDGQPSVAARTVRRYRIIGFAALILVLFVQVYWVVGNDLITNMEAIFTDRQELARDSQLSWHEFYANMDKPEVQALSVLSQKLDANYRLLQGWNRIWQGVLVIPPFKGSLTPTVTAAHDLYRKSLLEAPKAAPPLRPSATDSQALGLADLNRRLDSARNKMFMNELSAQFVLSTLQVYLLPLAYGLLGAATFVLRSLSREIRELTFLAENEVKYRLRLSLGSLCGLAVGWFLKSDTPGIAGSLSPLALAFVMGYNVELLFSLMDRTMAGFMRARTRSTDHAPQTRQPAPDVAMVQARQARESDPTPTP